MGDAGHISSNAFDDQLRLMERGVLAGLSSEKGPEEVLQAMLQELL